MLYRGRPGRAKRMRAHAWPSLYHSKGIADPKSRQKASIRACRVSVELELLPRH